MLPVDRREQVGMPLPKQARGDERIVGAAITGSGARGAADRWSDIDLFPGVADGLPAADSLGDWSSFLYTELGAIHHLDVRAEPATYRAFLLGDLLEVDLGFAPASDFGAVGTGAFWAVMR